MLRTVYDQVTETEFFVSNINLLDEKPVRNGVTTYEVDLVSCMDEDDTVLLNVPLTVTEHQDGSYTYAIADISQAIEEVCTTGVDTYNYHNEISTQVYDCEYDDVLLTSTGATYTELHTTVSIYQANKEPLTQEATTIPELIEILEEIQDNYTEVVVSGAFCKAIKRSK